MWPRVGDVVDVGGGLAGVGIVQEGALVEVLVLKGLVWYGFLHCGLFSFGAPAWRGPFGLQ